MRTNILIYYGFVHILFLYNTKFKSDQVQSWLQKTVPVAEITQQLRTGQARLIAGHESIIKPFLLNEIYGTEYPKYKSGFSPVIEYSNMKIIEKICADSTLIYYGDIAALFAGEQPEPTCRYQR
uniref:Uncharacterized protein n=1 Tax=Plectus sambesii TaxID=2011161 RepID=A0A914VFE0_9BILA